MCCATQIEVKQAREVMVEANTQEYAFNFLEQSLKNRIQDAEVCKVRWKELKYIKKKKKITLQPEEELAPK